MVKNIKPRVVLDERMLSVANRFYSSRLAGNALNRECFSDPDMESHLCNLQARLDGGEECTYCEHIFRRRCHLTCHIHDFCLAVYAYRLGLGDDDLWKAIKVNLAITYYKLHADVMEVIKVEANEVVPECGDAQDIRAVRIVTPEVGTVLPFELQGLPTINAEKESVPQLVASVQVDDVIEEPPLDSGEYLTVQEAADLFECTPPNIYLYIRKGFLEKLRVNGKGVVRKADILELKATKGKRKKKDEVIENAIVGLPSPDNSESESESEGGVEYISLQEAAELFECSYPNMHAHVTRGNLEGLRVNGKKVVRKADVLELQATKGRKKKEKLNAE